MLLLEKLEGKKVPENDSSDTAFVLGKQLEKTKDKAVVEDMDKSLDILEQDIEVVVAVEVGILQGNNLVDYFEICLDTIMSSSQTQRYRHC